MPKQVLLPFRHLKKAKAYEAALRAGGMEPLPVSVDDPTPFERAAGLLLMGGTDVNPKRYNSDAEPETDPPDDARDRIELDLIHAALERDLPILAIAEVSRSSTSITAERSSNTWERLATIRKRTTIPARRTKSNFHPAAVWRRSPAFPAGK